MWKCDLNLHLWIYKKYRTSVFSLHQTEYDSEWSFYQGSRRSISVMRGSPFLPPRPHQNLRAFFGAPNRGGLSNSQSIMAVMKIFTKPEEAPDVQLLPCHMCGTLCHSSTQNPAFYVHQKANHAQVWSTSSRTKRAGHEPELITVLTAFLHLWDALSALFLFSISSLKNPKHNAFS